MISGVRRASLVLLTILLVSGCGGGSGKRLSKQEYASKADAICTRGSQRTKGLQESNLQQIAAATDQVAGILGDAIRDLRKLKPPKDEQPLADEWLSQVEKLKTDIEDLRDKAKANDRAGLAKVAVKAQQDDRRANQLATQLGMSVCNNG